MIQHNKYNMYLYTYIYVCKKIMSNNKQHLDQDFPFFLQIKQFIAKNVDSSSIDLYAELINFVKLQENYAHKIVSD